MKNIIKYKGFLGSVHFSPDDNLFYGKVEDINNLVTFEGKTVKELNIAFHYVIDEHLKDSE